MSFIIWFRLLFLKKQSHWSYRSDGGTGLVTVWKEYKGKKYIIAQEDIAHGDGRNYQLDRLGL